MTEKKNNGSGGKTRREFLKDAGLLIGGTAIGSTVLLAACGGGEEATKTVTKTNTATVTSTAPGATQTITSTTTVGAGQTATTTLTETQTTTRFICPIDGMEFDTLAELQTHFESAHPGATLHTADLYHSQCQRHRLQHSGKRPLVAGYDPARPVGHVWYQVWL